METQPGARTALVDPFGRELEEWLRDVPAVRAPYVSDLVVPPVTGPITRPVEPNPESNTDATVAVDTTVPAAVAPAAAAPVVAAAPVDAAAPVEHRVPTDAGPAFRRDRGRHASVCAPSFPEPPERMALVIGDLAVEVSASSGRSTIERIDLLERELERRDDDLARLAAWEATVALLADPEVDAARAFAHDAFADIIAEAAAETEARERRRSATAASAPASTLVSTAAPTSESTSAREPGRTSGAPALPLLAAVASPASPVSATTRPTPLVQPATGPNAIHRAAVEEAIRVHSGTTGEVPTVFPADLLAGPEAASGAHGAHTEHAADAAAPASTSRGWFARVLDRVLRALGRR